MSTKRPIAVRMPDYGVCAGESVHQPGFQMAYRVDPFHKILYIFRGEVCYQEMGQPDLIVFSQGSFLPVPARKQHRIRDITPATLLLLCLSEAFVNSDPDIRQVWSVLQNRRFSSPKPGKNLCQLLERALRRVLFEQNYAQLGSKTVICAEARSILVSLSRLPEKVQDDSSHRRVAGVLDRIKRTFYIHWDLDMAANSASLSRRQFSQLFRKITGQTFLQALTELRLTHTAELLEKGNHSIIGAAFSSGFEDISHFYRLFHKHYGMPPGAWLAAREEAAPETLAENKPVKRVAARPG